jgi:hypothetical protein
VSHTVTVNVFFLAGTYVSIMGNKRQKIWQGGCTSPPLDEELMATSFLFRLSLFLFFFYEPLSMWTLDGIHQAHSLPNISLCAVEDAAFLSSATLHNKRRKRKTGAKVAAFSLFRLLELEYHVFWTQQSSSWFHFGLLRKPKNSHFFFPLSINPFNHTHISDDSPTNLFLLPTIEYKGIKRCPPERKR